MKKIVIVLIGLAVAGFAWWALSPLFITIEVDDAMPVEFTGNTVGEELPSATTNEPTESVFEINDTPNHPATGQIKIIETVNQTIVRYEDYAGTNGPDLFVYLAKDLEAEEFVNLGRARGNQGNINYVVPADVDINDYRYVMTWCRTFSELFDYAEIE